jgi:6-phospho-beta-glucosidase
VKVAVIGGAGLRTPLLVNGLSQSDLPIAEIALFDTDRDRLATVAPLAQMFAPCVRAYDDAAAAVAGAAFVFVSIRVGGIAARARDEAVAVAHGVVGQETVGPAGFAMAMRTVPRAVEYAQLVERVAPRAWVINFTNPVGIVSQAMLDASSARVIGICDTPTELFEATALALGIAPARCDFDYFGLNHLGWLREVTCDGASHLSRVWDHDELLARIYRVPLFEPPFLRSLRLLPTEYLFYYERPQRAFENMRGARTRGGAIAALNDQLFRDLATAGADARSVYERYLAARSASYMQMESGATAPVATPASALTGYDKIALAVVRAIHFNANAIIPLNVRNGSALPDLGQDDVVEVPCVVNANGARPLAAGAAPARVRDLLLTVKAYERLTIAAATTRARHDVVAALESNPLVAQRALAERLAVALGPW